MFGKQDHLRYYEIVQFRHVDQSKFVTFRYSWEKFGLWNSLLEKSGEV